jgi:hypothetical protein
MKKKKTDDAPKVLEGKTEEEKTRPPKEKYNSRKISNTTPVDKIPTNPKAAHPLITYI